MAEIINLRQRRKQKARQDAAAAGAENRARYGRPKAERGLDQAEAERARRELEHKKLTET